MLLYVYLVLQVSYHRVNGKVLLMATEKFKQGYRSTKA